MQYMQSLLLDNDRVIFLNLLNRNDSFEAKLKAEYQEMF